MRVLVNALPLRYGGGTTYLREQLTAFARVAPDTDLHVLRSPWTELDGVPGTVETVRVRSVAMRFLYEQASLGLRPTDVLYSPANFGPSWARAPMVLTVQNANYYGRGLALPEAAPSRPSWKVRANHWAMRRADAVVAISDSLAAEVLSTLPTLESKLRVIKSGAPKWSVDSVPLSRELPDVFLLSVASGAPHKRVEHVVSGWARSRDLSRDDVALVLVGAHTDHQLTRYNCLAGAHAKRLIPLGGLRDRRQLKWLYERARAAVSMSALEAFPLVPAEAGSVGCPLVLSDIPPHREVTQGRATFVDVGDVGGLADVLAGSGGWKPGSVQWTWPVTWEDNARDFANLFSTFAGGRAT